MEMISKTNYIETPYPSIANTSKDRFKKTNEPGYGNAFEDELKRNNPIRIQKNSQKRIGENQMNQGWKHLKRRI